MRMKTQGITKVVFLIDKKLRSEQRNDFSAVRLAVLKLLTHFSSRDGSINEKMRWGYRIFDSTKECHMYKKRAIWLQYKYNHFSDFEEHLKENDGDKNDKIKTKVSTSSHHENSSASGTARSGSAERSGMHAEEVLAGASTTASASVPTSNSSKHELVDDNEETSSAYAVRYALQNVMNDFHWEEPDMCSPMKSSSRSRSSRHRRKKENLNSASHNHRQSSAISSSISDGRQKHRRKEKVIFLVMQCPETIKILEEFVGDATKLNSAHQLRDTIVTKKFFTDFCQEQNGSLFWLNTNLAPSSKGTCELLGQMLGQMGGQVISLGWLMSRGCHVTSCLHSVQATQKALKERAVVKIEKVKEEDDKDDKPEKKIPVPRNILPLSIIIDHFLRPNASAEPWTSDEVSCSSVDNFRAILCSVKGDASSEHCMLQMMPMFTPESLSSLCDPKVSHTGAPQTFILHSTEQMKTPKRKTTRNQSSNSSTQLPANQSKVFSIETCGESSSQLTETRPSKPHSVIVRAKIDRRQLGLSMFDSSRTYSCVGYDLDKGRDYDEGSNTKGDGQLSQWFREALMDLSEQRMALIIELSTPAPSMTKLGILEPLTPNMASIHLLHPKSIMPLASIIAFQPLLGDQMEQSGDATGRREPALSAEVKRFVKKSVKAIAVNRKGGRHASRMLSKTEEVLSLPEIDSEMMEKLSSIKSENQEPFHPSWLEPWHISAPSRYTCDQVVEQLCSNPVSSSPSQDDQAFSNRLKCLFGNGVESTEVTNPPTKSVPVEKSKKNLKDAESVRKRPRLKRMKSVPSFVGVGRTANILANSCKVQEEASKPKVTIKEKKGPTLTKKKSDPIPIKLPDVSSVEDLTKHLKQNYEDVLTQNSCSVRFTQSTVAVALHFYQTSQQTSSRDENITNMRTLITDTLILTNKQLRERYADRGNDPATRGVRVQEVEMQTLLRLEMESVEPTNIAAIIAEEKKKNDEEEEEEVEKDDKGDEGIELPETLQDSVDEAVLMLQTVAIFASADKLSAFLTDVVLANYAETIPYMVRAIYEGLVKPVPLMLLSPGSDKTGIPSHKQPTSYKSVSSGGSLYMLGSNSNRSRALVRHPSIADAAPKRIIGVPAKRVPNEKKKSEVTEKKKKDQDAAKTVKRNLFNDDAPDTSTISRRRSVAVMETHSLRRSPRKSVRSGQLVLKTRVVKETPGKKQVFKAMLNKLDRARRRSSSKERATPGPGITLVIEESPEKPASLVPPDVRRSPRVHTLKRRPSFYKKQDMRKAKLLGARIAGTSPPPVPVKVPLTSEKKTDEKINPKLSPATFLLSAIISPKAKRESPADPGIDSPSRNTRSNMSGTPSKAKVESPTRNTVRTTPRAKARRRLNDQLVKDYLNKSPGKDHSLMQNTPSKSPIKSFIEGSAIQLRHSPRLLQKDGSADQGLGLINKSQGESAKESLSVNTRRSPRKGLRKLSFGSTENTGQSKDKAKPEPERKVSDMSSNLMCHTQGNDEVLASKMEKSEAQKIEESQAEKQLKIPEEEDHQSSWFDELSEDTTNKEQGMDLGNEMRHKRKRSTPIKGDLSTPPIKQRRTRRDTCTPPYVPASKCTTPEIINSWPRKKTRYNSPSPCTSKVLSPCDISPIKNMDDIIESLASPSTRRQTPQSSAKKKRNGSGRKRKRQSSGLGSSEKKVRRSSGGKRVSPKAKGSLLSMLSSKSNLEQRCSSPVFGKATFDQLTLEAAGIKTGVKVNKQIGGSQKKQQPARKCKSPGNESSVSSKESLDDLDRSFSPVFGKSMVTDPSATSQLHVSQVERLKSSNATRMSFIDQGLDSDVDTDPEIDFPKLKSGEGSEGILSDSEMGMLMSKDSETSSGTEEAEKPKRHLRRSPCENSSKDESSYKKLRRRKSPREHINQNKILSHSRTVSKKESSEPKTLGKTLGKLRSSEKEDISANEKTEINESKPSVLSSILTVPNSKCLEDVENTRPDEPPKKKKKRVTLVTRIPSSLGTRRSTPSRLSMTFKRPSAGENWMITNSPEPVSLIGASGESSFIASSLSSADDDVFEGTSTGGPSPSEVACTPPTQSGKPSFVATPLSATGLYSLMNSPLVASDSRKSSIGTPKSGRTSRSSRRNLPLQ